MTSRILATASVVALAFGTAATAQELPSWNPQTICAEDSTPQYCGFLEGQARSQISQQWEFIPTRVRARCLASNEELDSESWREFGNCLAEASRGPSNGSGSAAAADAGGDAASSDEVDALRAELEAAKAQVAELEAAANAGGASDGGKVAELEAELAKAQTGVRSSEVRIEGLQQRLLAAVDAQDGAADGIDAMQAALDKAEARARGAEFRSKALQATLLETIASGKSAKNETAALTERLAALDAQGDSAGDTEAMQAALDKAEARARGAEFRSKALQSTLMETIASSKAAKGEIEALEAELAKAQTTSKLGLVRIEGLQNRLMEAQDDASSGSGDTADLEAQLVALQAEVDAQSEQSRARIADLEDRLVQATKDASAGLDDASAEKIAGLEADLEKAQSSVRSGEVRIEGLQQRLMEAIDREDAQAAGADQMSDMDEKLVLANSRVENLKSRLAARKDAMAVDKRERRVLEGNLGNARTRIAALQDAMIESRRAAAAEAAAGSGANAEAVANGARLQRLLDNQRDRASRVGATVAEQRGRIRELESEVRTLRRAAATAGSVSCQRRMSDAVSGGGIQFANNKTDIRADAAQTIDRLIAIARDCDDARITVKGHTDTSGDRSYNLQLSQRRANAVVAYMERNGLNADRIEAIGVGPDEPIADNNTRAGRTQNRRIEIVVE